MEEYQCKVSGKMTGNCLPNCIPGNHYAGLTMKLEEMRRLEEQRRYKWEPHTCRVPSKITTPKHMDVTDQGNHTIPGSPTLPTTNPTNNI